MEGIDFMPEIIEGVRKVQASAKDLCPVYPSPKVKGRIDPHHVGGQLRESIHTKMYPAQQSGIVYTITEYGIYQEFGTRYQDGTPFMIPAMNMHRAGINQSMKKYLRDQLRANAK